MEDKTASQLELVLGVSNARVRLKAFEPKVSRNNYILIQTPLFQELSYRKQCVSTLLDGATACHVPILWQSSEFCNIYLLNLDGLQTRCMISVPLYLLYFLFNQIVLAHKWVLWSVSPAVRISLTQQVKFDIKSQASILSLFSKVSSNSVSFWRNSPFCVTRLEIFVSGAFSEVLNTVQTSKRFVA